MIGRDSLYLMILPAALARGIKHVSGNACVQTNASQGTPVYMAPEQHVAAEAGVGRQADMWGWAATMCHLLSGRPPFEECELHSIHHMVVAEGRHPEVPLEAMLAGDGLEQLLLDCFKRDPQARPTAEQALQRLDSIVMQGAVRA